MVSRWMVEYRGGDGGSGNARGDDQSRLHVGVSDSKSWSGERAAMGQFIKRYDFSSSCPSTL